MRIRSASALLSAALLATALTAGCNKEKSPTASAASSAASAPGEPPADTVVATYGSDQKVTWGQLNEQLKDSLSELERQKYQMRKQGLDNLINEKLVEAEAAKRGMTAQQLIKAEVDDKVTMPPEEQVRMLFEQAKGRLPPDATYEKVRPQIIQYLAGPARDEKMKDFFTQLRQGANVQVSLPQPARERKQVEATGPARGPASAPITIVEFSDFQCPYCSRAVRTVDDVVKQYGDKVRLVFRQFPLDFHKEAQKAAEAALCAEEQGKFWEFHDTLFANQQALQVDSLKQYASQLKLDSGKFNECLDSGRKAAQVKADMEAGQKVGVNGTPAFFINGIMLSGAQPIDEFKSIIDAELKQAKM